MESEDIHSCDRCESKIVKPAYIPSDKQSVMRFKSSGGVETEYVELCSMCLDDIWEFIFETDIDRSDKADPIPLEKINNQVIQHIDELEGILDSVEQAKQ